MVSSSSSDLDKISLNNPYSSIKRDEGALNKVEERIENTNAPGSAVLYKEDYLKVYESCSCCFGVSASYATPIYNDYCLVKAISRRVFSLDISDSFCKYTVLTICGNMLCPCILLPGNLYCICRGVCYPVLYGDNFSLARSDSCFCAYFPLFCTVGNTFAWLWLRLCIGSACTVCNGLEGCLDSVCGYCCFGRVGCGDRILSRHCPCHVDYVQSSNVETDNLRGYRLDVANRHLEEFFGAHHATAFDRYAAKREENKRLIKLDHPFDGSALHGAVLSNNSLLVVSLLRCFCARTDVVDAEGNTALMVALKYRKYVSDSVLRMLISSSDQSHLNIQNSSGNTALHIACADPRVRADDKIVVLLTQNHFDLCMRNNEGNTVLHIACMYGHSHIAKQFLRSKHVVPPLECITNTQGDTVLHLACRNSLWEVVEQFIFFIHNFPTDMSAYELLYVFKNKARRAPMDYVMDPTMRKKIFALQDPRMRALMYDLGETMTASTNSFSRSPPTSKSEQEINSDDNDFILIGEGVDLESSYL